MASDVRRRYPRGFVRPRIAVCAFPPIADVEGAIRADPFLALLVDHVDVARLAPASVREGSASKRVGRSSTRSSQWHCAAADAVVYAGASSFVGSDCVVVPAAAPAAIDSDVLPSEGGATACDLRRHAVRHHFLTRLYAHAELRELGP